MNFIIANSISVLLFVMSLIMIFISDNIPLSAVSISIWLIYTVFSNLHLIRQNKIEESRKKKEPLEKLLSCDKRKRFTKQITKLETHYKSILSREEYIKTSTETMRDLYAKILEQSGSNIESAVAYIKSYDYYTNPEPVYLNKLCDEGELLVNKFNSLVEHLVDIDTNPTELDMVYVDDVISCLDEMKQSRMV